MAPSLALGRASWRLCVVVAVSLGVSMFLVSQLMDRDAVGALHQLLPNGGPSHDDSAWDSAVDSTPHSAVDSTPHSAVDPTPHSAVDPTPHSASNSTPYRVVDPTPHSTVDSTPHSASNSTPYRVVAGQALAPFVLRSPSGRFHLSILASGSLSLRDSKTDAELFSSDTEYWWPVQWQAELTHDGVLRLSWRNDSEAPFHGTPWLSSLLPGCDAPRRESGGHTPVLELLDSGLLHIRVGAQSTCVLSRAVDDPGRLAIVYAGFLRTYLQTCPEHQRKLVEPWTGSGGVDVHVFAYYEEAYHDDGDAVSHESVTRHLRACFGDALKTVELARLDEVRETVADPPAKVLEHCSPDALNRHLSQWKTLFLAGQQVQRYMVEQGVSYDYILKARLDMKFWGRVPALSTLAVPPNGIVTPLIALDWTWYTMLHDGELKSGVPDVMAFGRPGAIFTYMALYRDFMQLRTMEKTTGKHQAFNTKSWTKDAAGQEGCTPENILAYWLRLHGIPVKTEWRFQMGLLRGDGALKNTCPTGRDWLCPGFVPQVTRQGYFAS